MGPKTTSWFSWRLYSLFLAGFLALGVLGCVAVAGLVWKYSHEIPSLEDLRSISPTLSTRILDKDDKPFGEFFVERRTWCPLDSIPLSMRQAVLAIEDRKFEQHWGINMTRLAGAVLANVHRFKSQGASTLTQQLARNVFLDQKKNFARKIKEAITAVMLEKYYTKDQLLEYYLNQVYLGASAYGVQAASRVYFGKNVWELRTEEAALIAGLIQRPESYRPDRKPDAARRRRNVVLRTMVEEDYLTKEQYQDLIATPVQVVPFRRANTDGAYFLEAVRQHIEKTYGEEALYHSGLVAHTTVDRDIQMEADRAVAKMCAKLQLRVNRRASGAGKLGKAFGMADSLVALKMDSLFSLHLRRRGITTDADSQKVADSIGYFAVQAAALVLDNATGSVRALTGGRNYEESKFNRAIQSLRQAGSTFKPFVYGAAIEQGALPSDVVLDDTVAIDDGAGRIWTPHNYDNKYDGPVTLRRALALSKNMPTIQVAMKYGAKPTVELAQRMGIRSKLDPVYALALGSADVTLWDMTAAYSVFANLGSKRTPHMIDSIMSRQETALERFRPKQVQVMDSNYAWLALDMMRDVVRRGTAAEIQSSGFQWPSGGKTGTTNDYTDGWYVGFTSQYTCGVWVGFDQKKKLGPGYTGAMIALPIWLEIMKVAQKPQKPVEWVRPSGVQTIQACGKPARDGSCLEMRTEFAVKGSQAWERVKDDTLPSTTSSAPAVQAAKAEPELKPNAETKAHAASKPHAEPKAEAKAAPKAAAKPSEPRSAPAPERRKPSLF